VVAAALLLAALPGAWARAGYDHNHPNVQWHTLPTEHFDIHWPESGAGKDDPHWFTTEFTAHTLARIAEESWGPICEQFEHCPEERIHVVVYDQDAGWEGNGFAVAEMDWTGFAANWGPVYRQRGRMEFLSDVFVHEFAHIVSLKAYLPWSEGTTAFSVGGLVEDEEWLDRWGAKPSVRSNHDVGFEWLMSTHAPFWWAEGGAEYWSQMAGYNFWGTSRDAFLRVAWLEDRVLDADEWTTRIDKHGFDGERGYNHGYAFGLWLHQVLGKPAMTEMAHISAERWHGSWNEVVREATGQSVEELHGQWTEHLEERYAAQLAVIEQRGRVEGRELSISEPLWEKGGETWEVLSKEEQEEEMDGNTAYQELPVYSPDGRYLAWFDQGLQVQAAQPGEWGAIGGTYVDPEDTGALDDWEKRHGSNGWIHSLRVDFSPDGDRLVVTGPEDWDTDFKMDQGLTLNRDGLNWPQLLVGKIQAGEEGLELEFAPVPNTLRAVEASWHPDGSSLAFSRYADGTHEIWTIGVDGSEPKALTSFGDGTQIQGIDHSPDGSLLLVGLFRNYQQDLWLLEVATGAWTRLTDSACDETDPFFGPDGRVWFTSDADDVYNVYALDLPTGSVEKQTELVGGAYGANVAPGGHLLYTAFTGHGYRVKLLPESGLARRSVEYPGLCGGTVSCETAQAEIQWRPAAQTARTESEPYRALQAQFPVSGFPILRTTERSLEAGAQLYLGDFTEAHTVNAEATFGKDQSLYVGYWNNVHVLDFSFGLARYDYKGTYGYGTDLDGVPETDDLSVVDVKFEQLSEDAWFYATTSPSWALWGGLGADVSRYSFRDAGDGPNFVPYIRNQGVGGFLEWTPRDVWYSGDDWINPRGGRRVAVEHQLRASHLVDPEIAGAVYDDGESLDHYRYNRTQLTWTEFVPVGWFGKTDRHTLQIDLEAGFIDRNVLGWDEFAAGGRHPYHWGSGTIGNNVQFSGFEGWSLTGETMLIANAAYRFPVLRDMNWRLGPIYTESLYLQVFGTLGNLWSYRVEGPSHLEGYSVVPDAGGSVRREIPFVDYASKNSPPGEEHFYLSDVGAEIRVRSFLWNDWDWDSFLRVAYGLQTVAGYGDVNADFVQSSVARDAGTELSSEVEPPTLHLYLGLGTGW